MASGRKLRLTPEQVQTIARVLADPRRFAILRQIAQEATMTCGALDARHCISPATISHHLKALQEADLIDVERQGRSAHLTLRREVWDAYLQELASL